MTGPVVRSLPGVAAALGHPAFEESADVVVVGTGAAGMSAALEACAGGLDVLVLSKGPLGGGSTPWAQGGLAAVLDPEDSTRLHAADTVTAAAGLGDPSAIDVLVGAAPAEIRRLDGLGARFDTGPLGLEGGHSRHRIVHAGGDASGAEVHRVLAAAVAAALATEGSHLRLVEHTVALDLVLDPSGRVAGLVVGRIRSDGALTVGVVHTAAVVLATGGLGQAYATTSNPDGVTGDGLALAARAGAEVSGVEFVQFHPTVLWGPGGRGRRPLITEALRGAGATLIDADGRSVMAGAHPLGDLAPRDVVAATMHRRMTTGDGPATHLWLDARGVADLAGRFPTVTAACREAGIDPTVDPIPVAPGAHYSCGGLRADMVGVTSVDGLYAVGEVASTGVHGANRLASNSLTECLATGRQVGRLLAGGHRGAAAPDSARERLLESERHMRRQLDMSSDPDAVGGGAAGAGAASRGAGEAADSEAVGVDPAARAGLADAMSAHAGVVRHGEGLEHLLGLLEGAPPASGPPGRLDLETVEATNLHTVATLIAVAALTRTESRGCHRRSDTPGTDPAWARPVVLRVDGGRVAAAVEVGR